MAGCLSGISGGGAGGGCGGRSELVEARTNRNWMKRGVSCVSPWYDQSRVLSDLPVIGKRINAGLRDIPVIGR